MFDGWKAARDSRRNEIIRLGEGRWHKAIRWTKVAEEIKKKTGYRFGTGACSKKFLELQQEGRAPGLYLV